MQLRCNADFFDLIYYFSVFISCLPLISGYETKSLCENRLILMNVAKPLSSIRPQTQLERTEDSVDNVCQT